MVTVHKRFIRALEKRGQLDRELEFLPTDRQIDQRDAAGLGLTSPEFAVLVAYSKITLTEDLLTTALPDDPWFQRVLSGYFPQELVERYAERLVDHPLRRQIIVTCVVNDLINRAGITFVFRASEETGASPAEVTRAYTVAREVFRLEELWSRIEALDNVLATKTQTVLYLEGRRLLDRAVRWLLQNRRSAIDVAAEVERFSGDVTALSAVLPELLQGSEREALAVETRSLLDQGVPAELADTVAGMLWSFSLLEVVEISEAAKCAAQEVAELYFALSDWFDIDLLLTRITGLPRGDRWQALARSALRYDLYSALAGLTQNVLSSTDPGRPVDRIAAWERANAEGLGRARATLTEIVEGEAFDIATLSVALRTIRTLLRT